MYNIDEIIGFEPLYQSMQKCKRGVSYKDSVAHYVLNGLESTYKLNRTLEDGSYHTGSVMRFTILKPKKREIVSTRFRDRVYQRSLNDVELYPVMTKSFIRDNWACQRGKGTDDARRRLKVFLMREYRKHGLDYYILQIDIHGYYQSMRHEITNQMIIQNNTADIAARTIEVLDAQYSGETGYNPGSQMVQIIGISTLNPIDHYIKERLRPEQYGRYMDDMILMGSKEQLEYCKDRIEEKLAEIGMTFNTKKTRIFPARDGFDFLGFHYRQTETGKIIMTVKPANVKAERVKLRKLARCLRDGKITPKKIHDCYSAWRNHASGGNRCVQSKRAYRVKHKYYGKANSFRLLERMDAYCKTLLEGNNYGLRE